MSISKEFVLDEDGMSAESSDLYNASPSHVLEDEEDNLDQMFDTEMHDRKLRTQMALCETFENFKKHTDMHEKEFGKHLSPLIRVAFEQDDYVQKMFESFRRASEVTRSKWEEERKERTCEMERELKFSNYLLLERGVVTVEQLDEEFQIADRNSETCDTYKNSMEFYRERFRMYFQKFCEQKSGLEECQKKCDELERQNRKLMKKLKRSEAKAWNADLYQKANENVSRKRTNSDSVKNDEELEDSKTVELIKKLYFPLFGSNSNGAKAAKKIPYGMKSDEKLCDHRVEHGLLSNGQSFAKVIKEEESTERMVEESSKIGYDCYKGNNVFNGCIDYNGYSGDKSTEGIVEESGIALWNGEKSSDGVQRSLPSFYSQQNVQREKTDVQEVVKGFNVLNKCHEELKEQYCEVIEEPEKCNSFKGQSVIMESTVLLPSEHSSEMPSHPICHEESKCFESKNVSKVIDIGISYKKLDDYSNVTSVLCDTDDIGMNEVVKEETAKRSADKSFNFINEKYVEGTSGIKSEYVKSSEVETAEKSQIGCPRKTLTDMEKWSLHKTKMVPKTIKGFKDQDVFHYGLVDRNESSTHLKKARLQKQGDDACGVVFQKKTKRRKQEESRPRTDPPLSTVYSAKQNDNVSKSDIQSTIVLGDWIRQSYQRDGVTATRAREKLLPMKESSSTDIPNDNNPKSVKEEPRPRKDPPISSEPPNSQCVHQLHVSQPREDPTSQCQLQYTQWLQMEHHHMPSTTTWSQFAIDVH